MLVWISFGIRNPNRHKYITAYMSILTKVIVSYYLKFTVAQKKNKDFLTIFNWYVIFYRIVIWNQIIKMFGNN